MTETIAVRFEISRRSGTTGRSSMVTAQLADLDPTLVPSLTVDSSRPDMVLATVDVIAHTDVNAVIDSIRQMLDKKGWDLKLTGATALGLHVPADKKDSH